MTKETHLKQEKKKLILKKYNAVKTIDQTASYNRIKQNKHKIARAVHIAANKKAFNKTTKDVLA